MFRYFYTDSENKAVGPVALEEIESLIRSKQLPADPMVVPEGSSEWRRLSQYRSGAPVDAGAPVPGQTSIYDRPLNFRPTILAELLLGKPLEWLGLLLPAGRVSGGLQFFTNVGQLAILLSLCTDFVLGVVLTIKNHNGLYLLSALLLLLLVLVGQFISARMFKASDTAISSTPHHISSPAVLECIDVILKICSVAILMGDTGFWIAYVSSPSSHAVRHIMAVLTLSLSQSPAEIATSIIFGSACVAVVLFFISSLARRPAAINVSIANVASGEDALGLLAFVSKSILKTVPIPFCLMACTGLVLSVQVFFQNSSVSMDCLAGIVTTVSASLLPVTAYLGFLVINLLLEVIRAWLVLPRAVMTRQ